MRRDPFSAADFSASDIPFPLMPCVTSHTEADDSGIIVIESGGPPYLYLLFVYENLSIDIFGAGKIH